MIYIENKKYKYFRASYLIIFNESDVQEIAYNYLFNYTYSYIKHIPRISVIFSNKRKNSK